MCSTTQYLYSCSHPATHRFRNSRCPTPNSRSCRIRDGNLYLPQMCRYCLARGRSKPLFNLLPPPYKTAPDGQEVYNEEWHVPSRCFVDIGFRTLDPFGTGQDAGSPEQTLRVSPQKLNFDTLTELVAMGEIDCCGQLKAWPRKLRREPSPCCLKERRLGAFEATRLEGYQDRLEGRIIDSACVSIV